MTKEESKQRVEQLVRKFEGMPDYLRKDYNEEQTKKNFILPLFEALGWDTYSDDVKAEENISGGRVDYAFKLSGVTKFYVEAKPIRADLGKKDYQEQLIEYAYNKGVTWGVLTDFEGLKIFNALEKAPSPIDLNYKDYLSNFDLLWNLSKESSEIGTFDQWAQKIGLESPRVSPIGDQLAKDLTNWRDILTKFIKSWHNELNQENIDEAVQKFLDRLIFIRVAEDRGLEDITLLPLARDKTDIQNKLNKIFKDFDVKYDSTLFRKHFSEGLDLEGISDNIGKIIQRMYTTEDGKRYNFSFIEADILGAVYEQYLGTIQRSSSETSKRKEQGIFYTPKFITNYIVKNTLGKILEEATSVDEVRKLRVLDPACGSGSFLIKSLDFLDEFYIRADVSEEDRRNYILEENLYGIDLDPKAVELAQLNLMLSATRKRELLPELQENIKVGNSLLQKGESFPIKKTANFDIVVGNPPWVESKKFSHEEKKLYPVEYTTAVGQYDLFNLFIERAFDILKDGGILGFIVPDRFITNVDYTAFREFLLTHFSIKEIIPIGEGIFEGVGMPSAIIILKKENNDEIRNSNLISVGKDLAGTRKNILQNSFWGNENLIFTIFGDQDLSSKIKSNSLSFGKIVENARGVEIGKRNDLVSTEESGECVRFLIGEDIDRYSIKSHHYLKLGDKNVVYKNPNLYAGKKLLVRKTGSGIRAVLDDDSYVIQVIYIFKTRPNMKYDLRYLLAILNSKLMGFYYWNTFGEKGRKTFPHLTQTKVLQLPIRVIDFSNQVDKKMHDGISELASDVMDVMSRITTETKESRGWYQLKSEAERIEQAIDQKVFELYGLSSGEIKIIEEN